MNTSILFLSSFVLPLSLFLSLLMLCNLQTANQKLVSFMCGLGLVGGAPGEEAGLSGLVVMSGDAAGGSSVGDGVAPLRGEAGVRRTGLREEGFRAGLVGEVGVFLQLGDEELAESGDEDGAAACERGLGDTEKVVGVLSPNLASNSLHTAKLRLTPSPAPPKGTPYPELPTASELLANSWQRSTKLPLRTAPIHSRSACLTGRGLAVGAGLWEGLWEGLGRARAGSRDGLARGTGGGACRGRLPHRDADEPKAPPGPRPPDE